MADTKISNLTAAASVADADLLPIVQGGTTKKSTHGLLKTWIKAWIVKGDVGLGNVDNTADLSKPISTATQTALDLKVPTSRTINGNALSSNVTLVKADIALGNVDNTSDANKPVSTATQTALDLKVAITRTYSTVETPVAMGADQVDFTKAVNTYAMSSDKTITYGSAPANGTSTLLRITADGTDRTLTLPTTYSVTRGATLSPSTILIPANSTVVLKLTYVTTPSARYEVIGDPPATNGTGNFLLSAGTAAIASGKTLTVSNTLTFTGTDASTVAFGGGGTVVYTSNFGSNVATFLATPSGANLAAALTSALPATKGGTGLTSLTSGDILYASASNTLSALPKGSDGQVLTLASGIPSWATPSGGGDTTISPTQITGGGDTANWNPTSLSTATVIRIDADANLNQISGIAAQSGHRILLINVSANTIILRDKVSGLSTAANRFANGGYDIPLFPGDSITIIYDGTSSVWRTLNVTGRIIPPLSKGIYVALGYPAATGSNTLMNMATSTNGTSAGATGTTASSVSGVCMFVLETGTDTTGKSLIQGNNQTNVMLSTTFYWRLSMRLNYPNASDGTNTYTTRVGFGDQATGSDEPQDGVFLRYTHSVSSGVWVLVVRNNNTETTQPLTAGPTFGSAFDDVAIILTPTKIEVWQNGVNLGSITDMTNRPTTRATDIAFAIAKSAGTTNRALNVGGIELIGYRATPN